MSWLKLDDAMAGHRKTRRLLRSQRGGQGLAAFGLHALALLHCSQYLTDGFVEAEFVAETLDDSNVRGKNRDAIVDSLLHGGQWARADGGFLIHDYLDHNPARDQVEAQRKKDAARKQAGRARQSGERPTDVQVDAERTAAGLRTASDGPVPSRPVLENPPAPQGGDLPILPTGKRQRDLDNFDAQVRQYSAEHFPAIDQERAVIAVKWAVGRPGADGGPPTHADVEAWVSQWASDDSVLSDVQRAVIAERGQAVVEFNSRAQAAAA